MPSALHALWHAQATVSLRQERYFGCIGGPHLTRIQRSVLWTATGRLVVKNVTIQNCGGNRISFKTTAGNNLASLSGLNITNCLRGIHAFDGSLITVKDSDLSLNTTGFAAEALARPSRVTIQNSLFTHCTAAFETTPTASIGVNLIGNTITENGTALGGPAGTYFSNMDNVIRGNTTPGTAPVNLPSQ